VQGLFYRRIVHTSGLITVLAAYHLGYGEFTSWKTYITGGREHGTLSGNDGCVASPATVAQPSSPTCRTVTVRLYRGGDGKFQRNFELQMLILLRHQNIAPLLGITEVCGIPGIVLDCAFASLQVGNFNTPIRAFPPFDVSECPSGMPVCRLRQIASQLADALAYLHSEHVRALTSQV
jgi:serine/threonine protein kinase